MSEIDSSAIAAALEAQDYESVISEVRAAFDTDPMAAMQEPVINEWLGRRYRNLFIEEVLVDEDAVKNSKAPFPLNLIDKREERERVAKRFLKHVDMDEINTEMPPAAVPHIENTTFILAPGLLTGFLPALAFQSILPGVADRFGIRILSSDSHPMRSPEANVADLENVIELGIGYAATDPPELISAEDAVPPGDVIIMGYSKGSPDLLQLLVDRPDLAPRIRAIIGWAGAVGGSYLADDIYKQLKSIPMLNSVQDLTRRDVVKQILRLAPIAEIKNINRRIDEVDILGAIGALTTTARAQFETDNADAINALPVPQFFFTGATSLLDVPYFQRQGTIKLNTYDQDNDMQLTQDQAAFPSPHAPRLAMFNANHWDLSYDPFPWLETMGSQHLKNRFARRAALSAIILFLAEIGLMN